MPQKHHQDVTHVTQGESISLTETDSHTQPWKMTRKMCGVPIYILFCLGSCCCFSVGNSFTNEITMSVGLLCQMYVSVGNVSVGLSYHLY